MESDRVTEHARDLTPAAYMQVVGIVQSVAMSYLLFRIGPDPSGNPAESDRLFLGSLIGNDIATLPEGYWIFLLQFVAVFQFIVLVWHANAQHLMAFKLRAGFLDALIPFSFALPEFFLTEYCQPSLFEVWSRAFFGITVLGIFAYLHLFGGLYLRFWLPSRGWLPSIVRRVARVFGGRVVEEDEEDKKVRRRVGAYPFFAVGWILLTASYAAYCGWLNPGSLPYAITRWLEFLPSGGFWAAVTLNLMVFSFFLLHSIGFWQRALTPTKEERRNVFVEVLHAYIAQLANPEELRDATRDVSDCTDRLPPKTAQEVASLDGGELPTTFKQGARQLKRIFKWDS